MLKVAIAGLGNWGQTLVNAVQGRSARLRFVAAATGRPERAAEFAARQGIDLLPDFESVLARPDVAAVVLATPHSLHLPQILAACRAGKPVFCEKPLTLTLAEARIVYDAAEKAGLLLAPGHNRRFLPAYARLGQLAAKEIGAIRQVIGNFSWGASNYRGDSWRRDPAESPAGGMTGLGIHVADAMAGLGLRASEVSVFTRGEPGGRAHTVTAVIGNRDGSLGILTTMSGPGRLWRLEVFGSEGRAIMESETRLVFARPGEPEQRLDFGAFDMERAELEAFADAVEGRALWPVTREEGLEGIALFEAICRGAAAPGRPVRL